MSCNYPEIVGVCERIVYSSRLVCRKCDKPIKKGSRAKFAVDDKGRGTAYHLHCCDHLVDEYDESEEYIAAGDIEEGMVA
jgi:hypothetical protein